MTLHELKQLLKCHPDKGLRLQLPAGNPVPVSFHITEVGYVSKRFIDCGGKRHEAETCQLQAWVGDDVDHRLESGKLLGILEKASSFIASELMVEIEYEDTAISQYPIAHTEVRDDALVFQLTSKHTDCLAKELCIVPAAAEEAGCCGSPAGCCG